jgi:modification methylase
VPPASVTVLHGDARELPGLPASSVDLIVTSPPYPMIPQWDELFAELGARSYSEMHDELARAWAACARVLVPGGILAINIGDALRSTPEDGFRLWPNHADVLDRCVALDLRPLPYLLWKKPMNRPNAFLGSGFLPPNAYVTLDCEFVLLFRRGGVRSFPPGDRRRTASRYSKPERDRWFSQIWEVPARPQRGGDGRRTAAFPPEIPRRLVRMFSVVGDTVLDPFAGTGTTLRAASDLGRRAIGYELDPERFRALARAFTPGEVPGPNPGGRAPRPRRAADSAARDR